jgi:hypothetical protein
MGIRAFIQEWRQGRAEDRAWQEESRARQERNAEFAAECAGYEQARQAHEREVQEFHAEHGRDLDEEPGWVKLGRQIEANWAAEEPAPYDPYAGMTLEQAESNKQAAESMGRYRNGQPARTDEEREDFREWAQLDADVVEDHEEMQQRERDEEQEAYNNLLERIADREAGA